MRTRFWPTSLITTSFVALAEAGTIQHPDACRMRATIGRRSVVLRRHTGISLPITRPTRIRPKPSWHRRGAIGDDLPATAFRLTS